MLCSFNNNSDASLHNIGSPIKTGTIWEELLSAGIPLYFNLVLIKAAIY